VNVIFSVNCSEAIMAQKKQCDVGLTEEEYGTVSRMAQSEGKPMAETIGELVRLGLPVKAKNLMQIMEWETANAK
jgi:hypothetical protein